MYTQGFKSFCIGFRSPLIPEGPPVHLVRCFDALLLR
jgi:hypothetical protein